MQTSHLLATPVKLLLLTLASNLDLSSTSVFLSLLLASLGYLRTQLIFCAM